MNINNFPFKANGYSLVDLWFSFKANEYEKKNLFFFQILYHELCGKVMLPIWVVS